MTVASEVSTVSDFVQVSYSQKGLLPFGSNSPYNNYKFPIRLRVEAYCRKITHITGQHVVVRILFFSD